MPSNFKITKDMQLKELISRIPPILNVDIVVLKGEKYLVGHRNMKRKIKGQTLHWLFPGGRVRWTETPQEAALRILKTELPGVKAKLNKIITATADRGYDRRAHGVTLYFLFEYQSGKPKPNEQLNKFKWINHEDFLNLKRAFTLHKRILAELDIAIRTRNTSEDEILVEVNQKNIPIGTILKRDAHNTITHYHRAAHMMIFNSKGEVVLQQRPFTQVRLPGYWDMHGGHQAAGQTIEQTAIAELSEELGISTLLAFRKIGLYKGRKQREFWYLFYGIDDGPYGFDRNEVAQLKAFDPENILKGKYKDYKFSNFVPLHLKALRDVWMALRKK
ncbi:MAG: NUDIX domain-containing protein [archaeon]